MMPRSSAIGMKTAGEIDAEIAVGPARQRLEADRAARPEIDDRLEMRLDLAGRHRAAQGLLDAGDPLGGLFHLARIDHDAAAPGPLGLVERRLGLADQHVGRLVAEMKQRTADRSRQSRGAFADIVGGRQDLDQHAGLLRRGLLAEDERVEKGEFVGADARHGRRPVHGCAQPHGDLDQDVVAGLAAEQIVDRLEAVEIEYADGERRGIVGAIADQALDLVMETTMIAQAGEGIGIGQFLALPTDIAVGKNGRHRNPACSCISPNLPANPLGKVTLQCREYYKHPYSDYPG